MMAESEMERSQSGNFGMSEVLYKVLVVGNFGVGKTSVIRRYTAGSFSANYKLTIGVDFALKTLDWDEKSRINMQLWDIAGHERFGHMTRVYYKYAIAAIIVFDLTRQTTFESVPKWLNDVRQKVVLENEEPVPILLLANKSDLMDSAQVDSQEIDDFCEQNNFIGWYLTSAKDNINIDDAMNFLVKKIIEVSSKKSPMSQSVSTNDFDNIDGQIIDLEKEDISNGHAVTPLSKPAGKNNDNCCV